MVNNYLFFKQEEYHKRIRSSDINKVDWRRLESFMRMADLVMRSCEILSAGTEKRWEQNAEGS